MRLLKAKRRGQMSSQSREWNFAFAEPWVVNASLVRLVGSNLVSLGAFGHPSDQPCVSLICGCVDILFQHHFIGSI